MANTTERGIPGGIIKAGIGVTTYEVESLDYNHGLRFPNNIPIYDKVRADSQVKSVLEALRLPILSASWDLHTEGVRPEVVALVRTELGLPEPGAGQAGRRRRHGIVWKEHLEQVLTMLWAGFMCFEQVYEVGEASPDQESTGLSEVIHLRKLAPRLPQTILRILTGRDGGLKAVEQNGWDTAKPVIIPVDNLVFYCHKREGADWSGQSILRTAYRSWLIKDALIRLDAQAAERNSMGIPVIEYSEESSKDEALQISRDLRAGATAGVALESGKMKLTIQGVQGSIVDLLPKINYHDQQTAKSALAMFLDLGHDNGARSLGETHLEVFLSSLQHTADYIADTATEHIIRDLVELNYGPEEAYPVLTPGNLKADRGIGVDALKSLVDAGVVRADDKLEDYLRAEYGLPSVDRDSVRQTVTTPINEAANNVAHQEQLLGLAERLTEVRQKTEKLAGK